MNWRNKLDLKEIENQETNDNVDIKNINIIPKEEKFTQIEADENQFFSSALILLGISGLLSFTKITDFSYSEHTLLYNFLQIIFNLMLIIGTASVPAMTLNLLNKKSVTICGKAFSFLPKNLRGRYVWSKFFFSAILGITGLWLLPNGEQKNTNIATTQFGQNSLLKEPITIPQVIELPTLNTSIPQEMHGSIKGEGTVSFVPEETIPVYPDIEDSKATQNNSSTKQHLKEEEIRKKVNKTNPELSLEVERLIKANQIFLKEMEKFAPNKK